MTIKDKVFKVVNTRLSIKLIVFITLLVYINLLGNSFIWDDYAVIVDNNFIKSWANLPAIFSKSYLSPYVKRGCCFFVDYSVGSGETSWRPVVTLSYFIDYSIWKLNPFGYHLSNLFLHTLNAILVFIFINLIMKSVKVALLTALLFALHPVNSEVVNVISFREDLLAFLFYLSSFIIYVRLESYHGVKKLYFYILSLALFFMALFSKEMSITLPLVLILYDYFFVFRKKNRNFTFGFKAHYLGYIAVSLFYIWIIFLLMKNTTAPPVGYPGGSFYTNLLTMSKVITTYLKWMIMPLGITVIMPNQFYLVSNSLLDPGVIFSIVLILIYFILAARAYNTSREVSFALFWFFVTLLPVLNIVPIPNYIASRYLYMPLIGFCFLVAILLVKPYILRIFSQSNFSQKIVKYIAVILLIFYSILSFTKNTSWKNDTVFYLKMEKIFPDNALVHNKLGDVFRSSGLSDKAIKEYNAAISLSPELVDAYNGLGMTFGDMGSYKQALNYFEQAIKIEPNYLQAYNNIGITYARSAKWLEARRIWQKISEIDPGYKDAAINLQKLKQLGY